MIVLRPSRYKVRVSGDGKSWRTVATVNSGIGTTDALRFPATPAGFVRLEADSSGTSTPPMLEELNVTG
jgi:hyaluronoglucosaminidase